MNQYPIFIICRDRVSCLSQLVTWLEKAGHERIYFIDNESTYEPLLEYYDDSPHNLIALGYNGGHLAPWREGVLAEYLKDDEYYIVTDPDVVPVEDCPLDAVDYFRYLLDTYQERTKAGFGMMLDDLPDHYKFKEAVLRHEIPYLSWDGPVNEIKFAPIDTTFALYRPGATEDISYSIRTTYPYVTRHLPWYIDSANLDEEEKYYRSRAGRSTNWNRDEIPGWVR